MKFWNNKFEVKSTTQIIKNYKKSENEIKKLLNFCDLDFEENCLNFYSKDQLKLLAQCKQDNPYIILQYFLVKNMKDIWRYF